VRGRANTPVGKQESSLFGGKLNDMDDMHRVGPLTELAIGGQGPHGWAKKLHSHFASIAKSRA
jgi:hypothetical protein